LVGAAIFFPLLYAPLFTWPLEELHKRRRGKPHYTDEILPLILQRHLSMVVVGVGAFFLWLIVYGEEERPRMRGEAFDEYTPLVTFLASQVVALLMMAAPYVWISKRHGVKTNAADESDED
jgi:hypothetical protein